ncbi:hypothetical protein SISSUDRAFT_1123727 [Sistotremastrum suecicum HHB10207 ss-3]|uniref:F-box domain-containing protein n=1 Tax=Sistotremastrum suecicum HHB10207 ss-3 TaxID=1314776 RepID=A0A165X0L4_9AGAM|nr:hypothetical protein SISSUDRAFT_1123727 [Sistotremastrum suecicum HHB10207 ss-3]
MSFDSMNLEMCDRIIQDLEIDSICPSTPARPRLKRILALMQLNSTFRRAALRRHSLWSTIYLEWRSDVVQNFLENARRNRTHPDLTVFLDTRASGTSDKREKHERWAKFLKEEMAIIRVLGVKIAVKQSSSALAAALSETAAPRLITFELDLDEKQTNNANIHRLFANNAPNMTAIHLHAATPFLELPNSLSLTEMAYRVTPRNVSGLFEMLRKTPRLAYLSLKGARTWDDSPLPVHNLVVEPVLLPACTSLYIRDLNALRTRYILSHIDLPIVSHLDVHERIVEHDNDLLATIFDTLPRLPKNPHLRPRDWLFLGIRSNLIVVQIDGYRFRTDWNGFRFKHLTDVVGAHTLIAHVVDVVIAPANTLLLQPSNLHIENSITIPESDGLFMGLDYLGVLMDQIFKVYPSVRRLTLSGNTNPITQSLHGTHSHSLPGLSLVKIEPSPRGNLVGTHDAASLEMLKTTRHIEIKNNQL